MTLSTNFILSPLQPLYSFYSFNHSKVLPNLSDQVELICFNVALQTIPKLAILEEYLMQVTLQTDFGMQLDKIPN